MSRRIATVGVVMPGGEVALDLYINFSLRHDLLFLIIVGYTDDHFQGA